MIVATGLCVTHPAAPCVKEKDAFVCPDCLPARLKDMAETVAKVGECLRAQAQDVGGPVVVKVIKAARAFASRMEMQRDQLTPYQWTLLDDLQRALREWDAL